MKIRASATQKILGTQQPRPKPQLVQYWPQQGGVQGNAAGCELER